MATEYGVLEIYDERRHSRKISLNGNNGDILLGGNGYNGDLLLYHRGVSDASDHSQATIHLNGRDGDLVLGGNGTNGRIDLKNDDGVLRVKCDAYTGDLFIGSAGRDGDILLFPRGADNINDPNQATIRLTSRRGDLRLSGTINFNNPETPDEQLPGWSIDQGATSAFQGNSKTGLIDFTHTHPAAPGDREKLRQIWIFNSHLTDYSLILLTPHAGAPCFHSIGELTTPHSICDGVGKFINIELHRKLDPGSRVRICYQILN